jgi:hypothetical protein
MPKIGYRHRIGWSSSISENNTPTYRLLFLKRCSFLPAHPTNAKRADRRYLSSTAFFPLLRCFSHACARRTKPLPCSNGCTTTLKRRTLHTKRFHHIPDCTGADQVKIGQLVRSLNGRALPETLLLKFLNHHFATFDLQSFTADKSARVISKPSRCKIYETPNNTWSSKGTQHRLSFQVWLKSNCALPATPSQVVIGSTLLRELKIRCLINFSVFRCPFPENKKCKPIGR